MRAMELCTLLYYKVQRSFFFSFIFSYNPALFGPIIPAYTFAVKISCDTSQRRAHLSFIFLPHPPELGEGLPDACWGGRWLHPLYGPCMLRFGFCSWRCLSSFSFPSFSGVKPENKANLQWSGLTCTVCPISTSTSGLSGARLFLSCVSCALHICLWCPQHWLSQEWSASSLSLGLSVSVHRFIFYMKALSQAKLYFFILLTSLVHCWRTRYVRPWILTSLSLGYFKGFMVIFSPKGCLGTHQMWTT